MTTLYERRLLNDAEVSRSLGDPLSGLTSVDDVTLEFENTDGFFNLLDLRGELLALDRFDRADSESLSEMVGLVVEQRLLADRCIVRVATHDLDALQTLIPKRLVTAATFPKAHATAGLNLPIQVIFGTVQKVELPFVNDDLVNNFYDYLVGEGTPTVTAVYRDTVGDTIALVPGAEYTINDAAFPGFRVIRFVKRQVTFSGGLHRLFADLSGPSVNRNFARAIQVILSDATWGLGLSVVTASFDAAAAVLDVIGNLFCDGVLREQRPALDYLNQLLMVRGMRLKKNSDGEFTISVDTQPSVVTATFGHGPGQPWRNVREFGGRTRTPLDDAVKTLFLDYRLDLRTGTYLLSATRAVLAKGQEKRIAQDFIRDRTTADKTCDYLSKDLLYGDQKIAFVAGQEARAVVEGDLIQYFAPSVGLDPVTVFRLLQVRRRLEDTSLEAKGWNQAIYTYQAGTLPAEPLSDVGTDTSRSTPAPVSSLILLSSGTEQMTGGQWFAFVVLQYTVPAEEWAETQVKFRRTGTTVWQVAATEGATGAGKQTRINGLTPGLSYDYAVERVNVLNPTLRAIITLSAQVAPGDTTAPTAPSAIAVRQGTGKSVELDFTFTEPADWATTELYRNTTNNSATAALIETGRKKRFHDVNVAYGTTYFYWAKVKDFSGNLSGFSPSSAHSLSIGQVNTPDINPGAVTDVSTGLASPSTLVGTTESTPISSVLSISETTSTILFAKAYFEGASGLLNAFLRIYLDGVLQDETKVTVPINEAHAAMCMWIVTLPAGSRTIQLRAQTDVGSCSMKNYKLMIPLWKR